ncbi:hypothetical protein [Neobacillus niacini]|nr:hypothetical protein [Neobacillus niacini]
MNFNQGKKKEEELVKPSNQEQMENAVDDNQTTEFDEMGTALNEI